MTLPDDGDFGQALRTHRQGKGMSLRQLAALVHCSHAHIADLESGRRRAGESLAEQLDRVLDAGGTFTLLLPESGHSATTGASDGVSLRSHKMIAGYIGGDHANSLVKMMGAKPVEGILSGHWSIPLNYEHGVCDLHIWSHGSVICHLVEMETWPSITAFAEWRYRTYERDMAWLARELSRLADIEAESTYILSSYWLEESSFPHDQLHSALKLICMPRTLVDTEGKGRSAEGHLLQNGFDHENIRAFGVANTSMAYASWSGVVYHPVSDAGGLSESELIRYELAVQSLWVFCSALSGQIENGCDPIVPDGHDWRWLRGARSRLTTSRSQETGNHRSMREAILSTSGLPAMLDETITILRETMS